MRQAYEKDSTALVVIDPYNDFISEGGKIWPRIRAVAEGHRPDVQRLRDPAFLRND